MSFNIEVKLEREASLTELSGIASYFAAPKMVVTGSFKLRNNLELRAFVEAIAKSSMVFGAEIEVAKLRELMDEVNSTQAAGGKR